ncbi:MAG: YggS family pyridoxal phosphate-dependent enzyme [Chloroflexota bacterium]
MTSERMMIGQNVRGILKELPEGVMLVVAAKTRSPEEVLAAIEAGAGIIGENYVQEADIKHQAVGDRAKWHFIGHLQKNKVQKAVRIFDLIETVDSLRIASEIDRHCAKDSRIMPVLIEVNSGREAQKSGVLPEETEALVREVARLDNIRVMGLMTMGPDLSNAAELRPYFRETKVLFEQLKVLDLLRVEMKYLSMGMTASYRVAIEEGASIVRIGSKIFGKRVGG